VPARRSHRLEAILVSLRAFLLGPMRAFDGSTPIKLPPRSKLPSLWGYLLVHRDRPTPRNLLAYTFWPDEPEPEARLNLRRHLHRLQQLLPSAPDERPWLLTDRSQLQWNPAAETWLDVAAFERLAHEPQHLEEAVGLYGGDLLEGLYDDWVFPERERLRDLCLQALHGVVEQVEHSGDHRRAIAYAQRMLRFDPLREETYRALMRLHARSGDRAGVVRHFNACVTVLRRELAVEPSPATHRAYEEALAENASAPVVAPQPTALARHNLPTPLTSFVGREQELAEVRRLLARSRLLTLTGIGGVGKTRLALAAAEASVDSFRDGVWWIDLSRLVDPSGLAQTVASTMGLREQSNRPIAEALAEALRPKEALLVLDNCEHLVAACADLAALLLARAPDVRVLTTSTEPFGVPGEVVWQVPPLPLPPPGAEGELEGAASIRLFVDRATAALPTFRLTPANRSAVAHLCRALDGIPLALELAAARMKLLSVEQLVERLDDRFRLLTGGSRAGLPRHRTMEAVLDWSYGLLDEPEGALLRRLSLFVGGFTLESAEVVCAVPPVESQDLLQLVSELVDKSLVTVSRADPAQVRYGMLETVAHYARVRLIESGEAEAMRRRFTDFCVRLGEQAGERLLRGPDQERWFWIISQEYDNLRSAIAHAEGVGEAARAARLAGRLWPYWWTHGLVAEGRQILGRLLPRRSDLEPELRAIVLHAAGRLMLLQGEYDAARDALEECLEVYRHLEDPAAIAGALSSLGVVAGYQQDYPRADRLWSEALHIYEQIGDRWGVGRALSNLGDLAVYRADHAGAVEHLHRSVALFRELHSTLGESIALINLGRAVFLLGKPDQAAAYFRESLRLKVELADKEGVAWNLEGLAGVAGAKGRGERAARLFGAADALRRAIGIPIAAPDRDFYQRNIEQAEALQAPETWQACWSEGASFDTERAIAYALGTSPDLP